MLKAVRLLLRVSWNRFHSNGFVNGLSSPVLRTTRGFPRAEESLGGGEELPLIQPTS